MSESTVGYTPFAQWRGFTTTTTILFVFIFNFCNPAEV